MVENEVDVVVLVADGDALLAGLETEAGSEFEEEGLEVIQQRLLQVLFQVVGLFSESGELQHVRVADEVGDEQRSFGGLLAGVVDNGFLVGGKGGAVVEQGADLSLELAFRPVSLEALVFVEGAFPRVIQTNEFKEVTPGKLQHFCRWQRRRKSVAGGCGVIRNGQ